MSGRRFPVLSELELDDERRAVIEQLASGGRKVDLSVGLDQLRIGPFEAMLLVPELASRVQAVGEHVRFSNSLPAPMRELAILLAARRWASLLEWHIHEQVAAREGLELALREAVRLDRPVGDEGSPERDVARFARLLLAHGHVDDGAFDAVAGHFGVRGALDLTVTLGYYCLIAFVLNVDRYPLPDDAEPAFETPALVARID